MGEHDHEYTGYANNTQDTMVRVGGSIMGGSLSAWNAVGTVTVGEVSCGGRGGGDGFFKGQWDRDWVRCGTGMCGRGE